MTTTTRKELEVLALALKKLLEHGLTDDAIEVLDAAINQKSATDTDTAE